MSSSLPSHNETPISRSRALYLGTSIFSSDANKIDESQLTLDQLQNTISERYPVDGGQFSKGVETWLSIYTNGLQMEHSAASDTPSITALFYYPMKALVYCGALRFISTGGSNWSFVPLDTEVAQNNTNSKNPSLFVCLFKGIDSVTKLDIIESNVFVVGTKEISFSLVDGCQQAYNKAKIPRSDFYKKYGNIPVVFCLKDELTKKQSKRVVVKQFDLNGYFYATENTEIDLWQLFEGESDAAAIQLPTENVYYENESKTEARDTNAAPFINPYEKTDNLVSVDKRVDPETGQNIYVRYLSESGDPHKSNKYEDFDKILTSATGSKAQMPPIMVREERTPSPIVYERYIKKKAPQVIIKEIHVQEPSPPPIKYVSKPIEKYHNQIDMSVVEKKQADAEKSKTKEKQPKSSILKESTRDTSVDAKISKKDSYNSRKMHKLLQKSEDSVLAANKPEMSPEPPVRSKARSRSKKSMDNVAGDKSMLEPIYAGVEHIKPKVNYISNTNLNNSHNNPEQEQDPNAIVYRPYNPYSTYYNMNGQAMTRRAYHDQPSYNRKQYDSSRNQYSNPSLYNGHANYYGTHNNYNGYNNSNSHYQRHSQHPSHSFKSYEQKKYMNSYDNLHQSSRNHNDGHRADRSVYSKYANRDDYSKEEKVRSGHSKKKIYLVNESELEVLKAQLKKENKNKKIVIVDESEVESLKYYNKAKESPYYSHDQVQPSKSKRTPSTRRVYG